jgi:hypothetical protein
MAGDAVVGALRIVLGMDTASFEEDTKKAGDAVKSFGRAVTEIAAGVQLQKAVEGAAHAIVDFGKHALETADSIFKLSQKTGLPVEELSGLKHAAELSDVSIESLARGFKNLAIEMNAAQHGGVGPAAAALQALGIDAKKVGSDTGEAFLQIAEKIRNVDDGMTKAALASAIFGKKFGSDLIPLLNQGRSGIEETIDSAHKLGLVFSTETAKNAEIFNDRMKDLKAVVSGIALTALEPLSAGLADVATKLVNFVQESGFVEKAADGLVRAIIFLTDNLKILDQILFVFLARLVVAKIIEFGVALYTLAAAAVAAGAAFFTSAGFIATAAIALTTTALAVAAVTGHLPGFTDALSKAVSAVTSMGGSTEKAGSELERFGIKTRALNTDAKALYLNLGALDNASTATANSFKNLNDSAPSHLDFDPKAREELQKFNLEIQKIQLNARVAAQEFTGRLAPGFIEAAQKLKLIKENGEGLEQALNLTTDAARKLNAALFTEDAAKKATALRTELRNLELQAQDAGGKFQGVLAPGFIQAAISLKILKEDGSNLKDVLNLSATGAEDLNNAIFKLDAARLSAEFMDPFEKYEAQLVRIKKLLESDLPNASERAKNAQIAAQVELGQTVADSTIKPIAAAFKELSQMNSKYAAFAKAAAIAEATVNMALAATKALTLGPILGPIAAAAVAAAGAVHIAAISRQQFPTANFAQGGRFRVGGAGGIDSQLVSFNATPGEMVDVRKPGQSTGTVSEITVNMRGRDLVNRDMIRDLFNALNEGARDGYRLKLAGA